MKQIMIVEDDEDIRELCVYLLNDQNVSVTAYATAEQFKANITSSLPDLIVLDIMLPDGNGVEICRELCANPRTNSIPVVLMSAHENAGILRRETCAQDFIAKPFDIDDFVSRVIHRVNSQA